MPEFPLLKSQIGQVEWNGGSTTVNKHNRTTGTRVPVDFQEPPGCKALQSTTVHKGRYSSSVGRGYSNPGAVASYPSHAL
jgi:hypothetical protein